MMNDEFFRQHFLLIQELFLKKMIQKGIQKIQQPKFFTHTPLVFFVTHTQHFSVLHTHLYTLLHSNFIFLF
jgi:hypothetical protein